MWYNILVVGTPNREGGDERMSYIIDLFISIAASVAGNYICKWLDRDKHDN